MNTYRIYGNTEASFIFSNQSCRYMIQKNIQKKNNFLKNSKHEIHQLIHKRLLRKLNKTNIS